MQEIIKEMNLEEYYSEQELIEATAEQSSDAVSDNDVEAVVIYKVKGD